MRQRLLLGMLVASLAVTTNDAQVGTGANALTLRDFVIDPPTLINLGFEWFVDGDDTVRISAKVGPRSRVRDWLHLM